MRGWVFSAQRACRRSWVRVWHWGLWWGGEGQAETADALRCPSLSARSIIRAALLLADDEDFQDQLRKLDGAAAKLQGMLIKMDKGECSPLDAEPPLKNFKRKLQSFAVEVTDLDADILKTSYPSKSLGGKHNPKSLHKKFKELERSSADRIERAKKGDLKRGAAAQFDKEGASAGQMLEEAQRIQGKDMDAVKRMQRQIDQTEQVAASTMGFPSRGVLILAPDTSSAGGHCRSGSRNS